MALIARRAAIIRVPSVQLPWHHSIIDLGTFGGPTSGIAINAFGVVTGFSYLSSADPHHAGVHAFRYADGAGITDVGVLPPGNVSCGNGINTGGTICGHSFVAENGTAPHAFVGNTALVLTDLGTGDDVSVAFDVNDHGVVTGETTHGLSDFRACIWTSTVIRDIGTLGGSRSVGRSINDSGQVAGESTIDNRNVTRAFRFTEDQGMISLGTLGGVNSSAYAINNSGQVVGESDSGPILQQRSRFTGFPLFGTHAFLWTEGVGMRDLGHLGGGTSTATAINNHGLVVGSSTVMNGAVHAFSWTHRDGMIDLNNLLPLFSGWVLVEANGVNDNGQITGFGLHNGLERAFRLDPPRIVITGRALNLNAVATARGVQARDQNAHGGGRCGDAVLGVAPVRSECGRLVANGPSPESVSQLTSSRDSVLSNCRRSRHPLQHDPRQHPTHSGISLIGAKRSLRPSTSLG
jgi:probable HAF family extracellular repeat protein